MGQKPMNVEQLHALAVDVDEDLAECQTESKLKQLLTALQNQISQPQQPNFQQEVSRVRQEIRQQLSESISNNFSPAWKQMLEEIGGEDLLGEHLRDRIEDIFTANEITTSLALEELKDLTEVVSSFQSGITSLLQAFKEFEIGADNLEPGESEISITIPRQAVSEELLSFSKELRELDKIITPFEIFVTGTSSGRRIRSISSSDLSIFLDSLPAVAALIATALERLVKIYQSILEIRLAHKKLRESGVAKKDLLGVEKHANSAMSKGINKLVNEVTRNKKFANAGDKTEQKTALRHALHKLAVRIDDGFGLSVRTGEPDIEEKDSDAAKERKEQQVLKIREAAKSLSYRNTDGGRILSLPASVKKTENNEEAD